MDKGNGLDEKSQGKKEYGLSDYIIWAVMALAWKYLRLTVDVRIDDDDVHNNQEPYSLTH